MEDLTNILQDDDNISEDELRKYLSGDISDEQRHAIEKKMADSQFVNDAVEGLQELASKEKLDMYVNHLNKNLHEYIAGKKEIKQQRKLKDLSWIILALIIILLLCILAYVVVTMQRNKELQQHSISAYNFSNEKNYKKDSFIL